MDIAELVGIVEMADTAVLVDIAERVDIAGQAGIGALVDIAGTVTASSLAHSLGWTSIHMKAMTRMSGEAVNCQGSHYPLTSSIHRYQIHPMRTHRMSTCTRPTPSGR